MRRRIIHPSSEKLSSQLERMLPEDITSAFTKMYPKEDAAQLEQSKGDIALGIALKALDLAEVVEIMGLAVDNNDVSAFLDAFEEPDSVSPRRPVYTEKTCALFHLLIVGTVRRYKKALQDLYDIANKNKATKKLSNITINQLEEKGEEVWHYTQLLWHIAYSRMLRLHSEVIASIPQKTSKPSLSEPAIARDNDMEDGDMDQGPEEIDFVASPAYQNQMAKTYQKWIRIHASYFASLESLMHFCIRPEFSGSPDLTFSIIRMNPSNAKLAEWSDVKKYIRKHVQDDQQGVAESIINNLKDHIENFLPATRESTIRAKFKAILKGHTKEFDGCVHCEAGWAGLKKRPELANITDRDLFELIIVMSSL
jgi:hypothetical protein